MNPTDTSEAGLETLICRALTGSDCLPRPVGAPAVVAETPAPYGGVGWLPGTRLITTASTAWIWLSLRLFCA